MEMWKSADGFPHSHNATSGSDHYWCNRLDRKQPLHSTKDQGTDEGPRTRTKDLRSRFPVNLPQRWLERLVQEFVAERLHTRGENALPAQNRRICELSKREPYRESGRRDERPAQHTSERPRELGVRDWRWWSD